MRADAAYRLARACGVTLEWLLVGEGPMRPGDPAPPPLPPAQVAPVSPKAGPPPKLFAIVNMDRMGKAMMQAAERLRENNNPNPGGRRLAQILCLIYDNLTDLDAIIAAPDASLPETTEHDGKSSP